MPRAADLHNRRLSLLSRLVDALAAERAIDIVLGLSPDNRAILMREAELAIGEWTARVQAGQRIIPSTPTDHVIGQIYQVGCEIQKVRSDDGPSKTVR